MPMNKRGRTRRAGTRRVGFVKRRAGVRRTRFRPKRSPGGYFKIVRKLSEFWLQNSGAGTARFAWISGGAEVNYTGTTATLGTPTIGMNGAYDVPFALNFRLSDVINYSDITTIADNYRIKSVYIRVIPSFTQNPISGFFNYPQLVYDIDKDDGAVATVDVLRQKMGVTTRTFKPGQYVGIKVAYPALQVSVADNTGTTAAMPISNRWLDCNDVNVPHLGLKGYISNMDLTATTTSKVAFKFDVSYTLEAKNLQ